MLTRRIHVKVPIGGSADINAPRLLLLQAPPSQPLAPAMASICLHATAAPLASRRAACAAGAARLPAAPRQAVSCHARRLAASPRAAITLGPLDTQEPLAPLKWCARRVRRARGARGRGACRKFPRALARCQDCDQAVRPPADAAPPLRHAARLRGVLLSLAASVSTKCVPPRRRGCPRSGRALLLPTPGLTKSCVRAAPAQRRARAGGRAGSRARADGGGVPGLVKRRREPEE
jgi:hypothetical protein